MTTPDRLMWVSPSLAAIPNGVTPAYEQKFAVPESVAADIERWAAERLHTDPHADPAAGNRYVITSVYLDTPALDVFHRRKGFTTHKYRVRRYGTEPTAHRERKSKTKGAVWKTRTPATSGEDWFTKEVAELRLGPVCRITYTRSAMVGMSGNGPIRMTLDRGACGVATTDFGLDHVTDGVPLLADEVILELKFLVHMPVVFQDLLETFHLAPSGLSKYRRCVSATGQGITDADDTAESTPLA